MNNKVGSRKTSTNQLQQLKPEDNLPPQQPIKKSWSRRFVQKIIDGAKWIKDLITFKRDTKIITRKIADNYLEPIEKKELRNIEFEQMVKQGTFSNEVWYAVKGDVALENIKSLPQHIKIFGDCEIKNSPKLKKLSSNFIITGDVNFDSCSSLKMNADDSQGLFYIHGELVANNCNNFDFINSEKKVSGIQGAITINSCNSFSYLPAGINNDVNIINCKNFKELLAGNYHNLKIEYCNHFTKIHPNTVTENLILNNNKKFNSFTDNLIVKNLSVISCPIKSFTNKITISQDLLFESCKNLKNIQSSNIQLEGDIMINNCQQLIINIYSLRSWPEWICSPKADGSLRSMQILGNYKIIYCPARVNLISPSIKNMVNKSEIYSIDIILNHDCLIESFSYIGNCRDQLTYPYISKDLPERDKNNILAFLKKIRLTKDYLYGDKELLGKQIVRILSLFQKETDSSIAKMAIKLVNDHEYTNADASIILLLDNLIMLTEQKEAQESGDITKIRAASKYKMMIEISDSIAEKNIEYQVHDLLKSRLQLRGQFGLPIEIRSRYCDNSNFNFFPEEYSMLIAMYTDEQILEDFIEFGSMDQLQIERYLEYYQLPVVYTDTQPECGIYQDFYDEMVIYKRRYYSYDAFLEWYNKNGTDPYIRYPIDMSELYRVDYKDVEDDYIKATETKELTSVDFEELLASGEFSNNVHYIVTGNVNLNHYPHKYLPQHVKILGDFTLKNALMLKHLPYNFTVTGKVSLENCITFRMRDCEEGTLDIQQQLMLTRCPALTDLPTKITYDIHILECNSFREVASGNYQNLIIEQCANFSKIHPNTVVGNLSLIDNKNFILLPDNLTVKNLSVISCPIEFFTNKMTILQDLLLESCENLQNIQSSNIQLEGDITINNCQQLIKNIASLSSWPGWICSPKADGSLRSMRLLGYYKDISAPVRVNLISPTMDDIAKKNKSSIYGTLWCCVDFLIELFAFIGNCRDQLTYPYISEDLPKRDRKNLLNFLDKIRLTQDYKRGDKELLGKQIVRILSLFQKETDPTIRKMALEIVEESVSTCVDRTILALDDLLMLALQQEAKKSGDMEKYRAAMKHNMIIGMADSISRRYGGDQIENVLKARIEIRKIFNLPTLVQSMSYKYHARFSGFSSKAINQIKANSTDEQVNKFIAFGDPNWNEFQKTNIFLPNFEELPVEDLYAEEMPECCLTNMVYDEMVEYKGGYYGYEALLRAYRNKQSITNDLELIDPKHIHKVVLKKDANI